MFEPASRHRSFLSGYGLGLGGAILALLLTVVALLGTNALGITLGTGERFLVLFVVGQYLPFMGFPLLYFTLRGMTPADIRRYLGVRVPSLKEFAVVLGGVVTILTAVIVVSQIVMLIGAQPAENSAAGQAQDAPDLIPFLILGMLFVVGPCEEMLFRGTVQNRLREGFSAWLAIPLTAVLFAAVHYTALTPGSGSRLVTIGILLVPSLVFGVIYEYTDNLVVPALTHGLWNSFLLSLIWLGSQVDPNELQWLVPL